MFNFKDKRNKCLISFVREMFFSHLHSNMELGQFSIQVQGFGTQFLFLKENLPPGQFS